MLGVAGELAGHLLVGIDHRAGDAQTGRVHRLLAGRDHQVATQQQFRTAGTQAHRADLFRVRRDLQVRQHGTALLRQSGHVQTGEALVLEMRRHAEDGADGHHASAAHTRNQDAVGLVDDRQGRFGQDSEGKVRLVGLRRACALAHPAAVHGDKAGAESLHAGVVLVAGGLIDSALAAELGFKGSDGHAVRLHAAVAAAFAHQIVDERPLGRVGKRVALAPAALLRGAGLIVDDHRGAFDLADRTLPPGRSRRGDAPAPPAERPRSGTCAARR